MPARARGSIGGLTHRQRSSYDGGPDDWSDAPVYVVLSKALPRNRTSLGPAQLDGRALSPVYAVSDAQGKANREAGALRTRPSNAFSSTGDTCKKLVVPDATPAASLVMQGCAAAQSDHDCFQDKTNGDGTRLAERKKLRARGCYRTVSTMCKVGSPKSRSSCKATKTNTGTGIGARLWNRGVFGVEQGACTEGAVDVGAVWWAAACEARRHWQSTLFFRTSVLDAPRLRDDAPTAGGNAPSALPKAEAC
ncbi:hypothetical protein PSPO01_11346 [Paraphaeosphaeria sporulosa]